MNGGNRVLENQLRQIDGANHQVGHHLLRQGEKAGPFFVSVTRKRGHQHDAHRARRKMHSMPWLEHATHDNSAQASLCRFHPPAPRPGPGPLACTLAPSAPGVADRPSTRNLQRASRMCFTASTISWLPAVCRGGLGSRGGNGWQCCSRRSSLLAE